jgi:hypothetical protein
MKKNFIWVVLLGTPLLNACTDNDYDLSDIDTNVSVPVKDLTIPVEMESLTLKSVLDIKDDSKIKEINGEYAVVVEGTFESEPVHVESFTANVGEIESIAGKMVKQRATQAQRIKARMKAGLPIDASLLASYVIPTEKTSISASAATVNNAIKGLKDLKVQTQLSVKINVDKLRALADALDTVRVEGLKLQLPKGVLGNISLKDQDDQVIEADVYDPTTGIAEFISQSIKTKDGEIEVMVDVEGLDENAVADALKRAEESEDFLMEAQYGVSEGEISVYTTDFKDDFTSKSEDEKFDMLAAELDYNSGAEMEDLAVKSLSGSIDYELEQFDMESIGLDNIPDLLSESGTSISLANPQLYLYLNNPVMDGTGKTIAAQTKMMLIANSKDNDTTSYAMDDQSLIDATAYDNYFCLSPNAIAADDMYTGYESATYVPYASLSDILAGYKGTDDSTPTLDNMVGSGIPASIDIQTYDTHIKDDDIEDYALDQEYTINGNYVFYAPLALNEDSHIKYTETYSGWYSDIEGVSVRTLEILANVSTDVPFEIQLRVTPTDTNGKKIANSSTTLVAANAKDAAIDIKLEGEMDELDGVILEALAVSKSSDVLRPNMNIQLNKVRAKVSGSYTKEL